MKIEEWNKIEEVMTELMGWDRGIGVMCDEHRSVAAKKPVYDLTEREDKKLKYRLRKRYIQYKNRTIQDIEEKDN